MKNLIVYYSFTANNEKLASHLKEQLNCDIAQIETVKKRSGLSILLDLVFKRVPSLKQISYSVSEYDHVILVAPIWAGKIATPMRSFLMKEKANLKHYAFISLCGGGDPKQKANIQRELSTLVGKDPANVVELWINHILSADEKGKIKYTTGFRVDKSGLDRFQKEIENFLTEENLLTTIDA